MPRAAVRLMLLAVFAALTTSGCGDDDDCCFIDEPTPVAEWSPTSATSASSAPLAAGHYTWKAWTRERGLDIELGSRDFEVVHDDALLRELAAILESGDDDAGVRAVALLDARGFRADARVLARTLPASAERDAYLGRTPGR